MTRATLSVSNRTEVNLNRVGSVQLVSLGFPGGAIYTCTGNKAFAYGGHTYVPDGKIISIGGLSERGDGTQDPIVLVLNGVDATLASRLDDDDWHFSPVQIYQLFLDEEHLAVDDPHDLGAFYMSHTNERFGEKEDVVELTCENALFSEGGRVDAVLCEDALHRARSTGDTYWANVLALVDREVVWAGLPQQVGGVGGGLLGSQGFMDLPQPNPLPQPMPPVGTSPT